MSLFAGRVPGQWRRALRYAGMAMIAVILYYLGRTLYLSWHEIPFGSLRFHYGWLTLSFVVLTLSFICGVLGWQGILRSLGSRMSFPVAWWVITGSYLAKYLPGHVWAVGGRMVLCKQQGVPEKVSGTGMVLEMIALLLGSLITFFLAIPWLVTQGLPRWVWFLAVPIPALAVLFFTPLLPWGLRRAATLVVKREVQLDIAPSGLAATLGLYVVNTTLQGLAYFLLIRSIHPLPVSRLVSVIGIYNGAWAAGFLSFIAPGGLGVREGVMTMLLKPYLPVAMAIIVAAVSRLWITLFEVAMAAAGLRMRPKGPIPETIREQP
jgi:glycosyltransferase 2 family protein